MRTIDADKVIEKLKEHKSLFCKNRDEFRALSDKDKARVDEIDTCIAELVNAEGVQTTDTDTISRQAVKEILDNNQLPYHIYPYVWDAINELPPSKLGTNLADVGTDCISRQAAIDAVNCVMVMKGIRSGKSIVAEAVESAKRIMTDNIRDLPPALPEPMKIDLSRFSEENWERIKKEWANTPITTIAAEPYTIIDGRLFITVDDIEQVDCVLVAEYKSKFCREFWMADADEPARPERIKGHWIESDAQNRLMKNFIEKGETWRVCDKCGAGFMIGYQYESDKVYHETFHNFCPKCGAEMEVTT